MASLRLTEPGARRDNGGVIRMPVTKLEPVRACSTDAWPARARLGIGVSRCILKSID